MRLALFVMQLVWTMMADCAFRNLLDIRAPTLPEYVHAIAHAGLPACHKRDVLLMVHNMYGQISRSLEELHVSGVCFTLLECTIYTTITEKSLLPQQLRGDRSRRWCHAGGTHDDCTGDISEQEFRCLCRRRRSSRGYMFLTFNLRQIFPVKISKNNMTAQGPLADQQMLNSIASSSSWSTASYNTDIATFTNCLERFPILAYHRPVEGRTQLCE
ncbi:hypothetical protein EDD15DRAFT_718915 [Pisolithus albus]|nr:hypothetical protein EDD15DRAFT_718915 [Pisolithus albus]